MTLLCVSGGQRDTFLLVKEGATDPPLRFKVNKKEEITEAKFSLGPVTSAHGGTYRCYSSSSRVPYGLSHPSASVKIRVSGETQLCSLSEALLGWGGELEWSVGSLP